MNCSILLYSPDDRDRRRLLKALGATGCKVYALASLSNPPIDFKTHRYPFWVIAEPLDGSPAQMRMQRQSYQRFLEDHTQSQKDLKVLILSNQRRPKELKEIFELPFFSNLVARNHPLDLEELIITVGKIFRDDIFGMEKYLCYGVEPRSHPIQNSHQKSDLIQKMEKYALDLGIQKRLINIAKGVADELIMNAIYNAPVSPSGEHLYLHHSRSEYVSLQSHEQGIFRYACDGRHFVISVRDPFGSLSDSTIIRYLSRCFEKGQDQIEHKSGGAGMGFYFILENLNKLIVNLWPGHATELIGLIDVSGSYRNYRSQYKSFHIFKTRRERL